MNLDDIIDSHRVEVPEEVIENARGIVIDETAVYVSKYPTNTEHFKCLFRDVSTLLKFAFKGAQQWENYDPGDTDAEARLNCNMVTDAVDRLNRALGEYKKLVQNNVRGISPLSKYGTIGSNPCGEILLPINMPRGPSDTDRTALSHGLVNNVSPKWGEVAEMTEPQRRRWAENLLSTLEEFVNPDLGQPHPIDPVPEDE